MLLMSARLSVNIRTFFPYVMAGITVGIITIGFFAIHDLIRSKPGSYAMAGIMAVTLIAARWGAGPAIFASILLNAIFGFFCFTTYFLLEFDQVAAWILWVSSTIASLTISLLLGQLSVRIRYRTAEAKAARKEAKRLRVELLEHEQGASISPRMDSTPPNAHLEHLYNSCLIKEVSASSSLLTLAMITACFTTVLMTLFEVVKQFVFPNITIWQSHITTVVFTTHLAIMVASFVGHRLKLLNARLALLNAELWQRNEDLLSEIQQRYLAEARIHHMAHHDALTGLPNRILLEDRINQAIAQAQRSRQLVAVLFIDLDHFKCINDSFGHQIGDRLLQLMAIRFQECLRKGDSVARLGGDEFILILPALTGDCDAVKAAQKVLDALQQTFVAEGHELHVTGSIGISFYPTDGPNAETLLQAADMAMYHAKTKGRGNYQFFSGLQ